MKHSCQKREQAILPVADPEGIGWFDRISGFEFKLVDYHGD